MIKYKLPKGFLVNGVHCGVKNKRKDLSLFYSGVPCKFAALFTKNMVKAAPVLLAQEQLRKTKHLRGVLVNSGNANCMTGKQGMRDAKKMVSAVSRLLGVSKNEVLVSSTGIIGKPMEMKPVINGLPGLISGLSAHGITSAADGIMTTDRFHKIATRIFKIGEKKIVMTGVAKGAGMIKPDMATMLCYIMTDANISGKALKKALAMSADNTFNAITVDGDMSTNDTAIVLANGEAGNDLIDYIGKDFKLFLKNLETVSGELARMIVLDGEGATKLIEVRVKGVQNKSDAKKLADAIAGSLLVKCAVLGGDPNWGRIASSAGASGVGFNPDKMTIVLDGVTFFKNGKTAKSVDRKASVVFKGDNVRIDVDFHNGKAEAVVYSCDVSKKYITLNSYYTT